MVVLKEPFLGRRSNYQENGRPHTAKVAMGELTEIGGTPLEHPPYSLDLAPCDFWAFPTMKRELRGKKTACSTVLLKHAEKDLQHLFEKWVNVVRKRGRHRTFTKFRLGVLRYKRPLDFISHTI
jgi:transposase